MSCSFSCVLGLSFFGNSDNIIARPSHAVQCRFNIAKHAGGLQPGSALLLFKSSTLLHRTVRNSSSHPHLPPSSR